MDEDYIFKNYSLTCDINVVEIKDGSELGAEVRY